MGSDLASLIKDLESRLGKLNRAWMSGSLTYKQWRVHGLNLLRQVKPLRVNKIRNIKTKNKTNTKKGKRDYMREYMRLYRKEKG